MSPRKVIALMMGSPGLRWGEYQALLRAGVEQVCVEHDIDLWVYAGRNDWSSNSPQRLVYDLVTPDCLDGIILASAAIACFLDVNQLFTRLRQRCPVPVCSMGHRFEQAPSVIIDNRSGMASVVAHMAELHGCREFAFVAGPRGQEESEERLAAARDTLAGLGLELPEEAIGYGNFSKESGVVVATEILRRRPSVEAIIAANDDMAVGVLQALAEHGRRCPEQVAVAGFDDALSSRISRPAMTTVRQPVFQLGVQAASWIMNAWRGEDCPRLVELKTEAVLRESCGCDPLLGPPRAGPPCARTRDTARQQLELRALLANLVGSEQQREAWADQLWRAVDAERSGQSGCLRDVVRQLLDEASHPDAQVHDLQRAINYLRIARADEHPQADLTDAYCSALTEVCHAMHHRETRLRLDNLFLDYELQWSGERVATSLSFDSLRDALVRDLPRFSVQNAIVSVLPAGDLESLVPLVCLVDGHPVSLEPRPYPARRVRPDGLAGTARRCSYSVLPLTFEQQALGVAMLELPVQGAYMILREQISSAIRTVRLHETLMQQQERLKLQAQNESQATAERLRTLSVIAGGVAHDLNNVLGPLVAMPDAIRQDLVTNPGSVRDVLADLDILQEAAERAAHTIRDLLTLGRAIDIPKRAVELNRMFEDSRRTLSQLAERSDGVRLRLDLMSPCACRPRGTTWYGRSATWWPSGANGRNGPGVLTESSSHENPLPQGQKTASRLQESFGKAEVVG